MNKGIIEKLEMAQRMMKDRRHDVAGLGGPIMILEDVIRELKDDQVIEKESLNYWQNGGPNGPTGHGDICHSDADPGL
jgi:hypothetical protein